MKFRQGFVTNSSSSSFILALNKIPKNIEDVKDLLFDKSQVAYSGLYSSECFKLDEVAESVLRKIQESKKEDIERSMDGYYDDAPKYNDYLQGLAYKTIEYDAAYAKYRKECEKFTKNKLNEFKEKNKKSNLIALEFSDNDGNLEAAIEHGELFNHIPHIKISHH